MFSNIPFPSLFVCFLIFCAWLHYEKRKATREDMRASKEFWQRESEANASRNKDISHLPFFELDEAQIPLSQTDDENICYYQEKVRGCLALPMMNLSGYTNTDLKLSFGIGNFKTLSSYDENYNSFLINLSNLGKAYHMAGLLSEAEKTYLLCLDSGSDKAIDYLALADIYHESNDDKKLTALIDRVETSDLPRKESLLSRIRSKVIL
nr:hypothetical protein [Eubacterium sp.]